MWLIVSWWAAIAATAIYIYSKNPKAHRLDWLCLMLWGLAVMVLVDHVLGFIIEGGEFIEISTEGYIENGTLLGITMLIPIFLFWEISALISQRKEMPVSESFKGR
ncbi:MAG: hypothetical protein QXU11_02805 [Thermoproteota archaeon]